MKHDFDTLNENYNNLKSEQSKDTIYISTLLDNNSQLKSCNNELENKLEKANHKLKMSEASQKQYKQKIEDLEKNVRTQDERYEDLKKK